MLNQNNLISIIMPAYQAEKTITDSINSIINQTYQNWELIIIDDFSSDNTGIISNDFCQINNRIKYQKLEKNYGGPAHPRNIGIKNAKGDIIAFCDSDDVWDPIKLQMQLEIFCDYIQKDILICSDRIEFTDIDSLKFPTIKNNGKRELTKLEILLKNGIILSSVLVSKDTLVRCNYFDEDPNLIAVEDYDMWLKITQLGKTIILLNDPLIGYRLLPTSLSANKLKRLKKFKQVYKNYYQRTNAQYFLGFRSNIRVFFFGLYWLYNKIF